MAMSADEVLPSRTGARASRWHANERPKERAAGGRRVAKLGRHPMRSAVLRARIDIGARAFCLLAGFALATLSNTAVQSVRHPGDADRDRLGDDLVGDRRRPDDPDLPLRPGRRGGVRARPGGDGGADVRRLHHLHHGAAAAGGSAQRRLRRLRRRRRAGRHPAGHPGAERRRRSPTVRPRRPLADDRLRCRPARRLDPPAPPGRARHRRSRPTRPRIGCSASCAPSPASSPAASTSTSCPRTCSPTAWRPSAVPARRCCCATRPAARRGRAPAATTAPS